MFLVTIRIKFLVWEWLKGRGLKGDLMAETKVIDKKYSNAFF